MDSTRPIPFQAAAAYGMKPKQPAARVGSPITPPAARPSNTTDRVSALVSGKVDSPVGRGQGFDAPQDARRQAALSAATGALQMYSRAADRVEVATAAHLGRILDTRG